MTCSVVHSTDVELDARLSTNLSIDLSDHRNAYCSRLTMRGKERSLQQAHYLTQKHEVGRFADRQNDVSRQIIALTVSLKQTHQPTCSLKRSILIVSLKQTHYVEIDLLIEEIDSDRVIEAGSLVDLLIEEIDSH